MLKEFKMSKNKYSNPNDPLEIAQREEKKIRRLGISVIAFSVICSGMIGLFYLFWLFYGLFYSAIMGIFADVFCILILLTYVAGFIVSFVGGLFLSRGNKKGKNIAKTGVFLVVYFSCFSLLLFISVSNSCRPDNTMFSHVFVTVITTLIFVAPVALPGIFIYRALNRIYSNKII
jgi:magnesium-transporting ATPase (P-type)